MKLLIVKPKLSIDGFPPGTSLNDLTKSLEQQLPKTLTVNGHLIKVRFLGSDTIVYR